MSKITLLLTLIILGLINFSCEKDEPQFFNFESLNNTWWTTQTYCNSNYDFTTYGFLFYENNMGLRTVPVNINENPIKYDSIEIEWRIFEPKQNLIIDNKADTTFDSTTGEQTIIRGSSFGYHIENLTADSLQLSLYLVSGLQDSCYLVDENMNLISQ